jgi:hypothetical protein
MTAYDPVAERPCEGSRGLQSTEAGRAARRRGATIEIRCSQRQTDRFNRRSATAHTPAVFRGLKSTATLTLSLRDSTPGASFRWNRVRGESRHLAPYNGLNNGI